MTTTTTERVRPSKLVDAPTRGPLPFGLFSMLQPTTPVDPHWQNGVEWQALECGPLRAIGDPACEPGQTPGLPKQFDTSLLDGSATAFTVYGEFECDPIGSSFEEIQGRATQRLLGGEQTTVERILWTGELGNRPAFATSEAVTDLGSVGSPQDAVAAAEQYLGQAGVAGVIHASRNLVASLPQGVLSASGSVLRTLLGTPVVAGGGYPNDGRVFVTSPLFGYRSEIFNSSDRPGDLLDREQNDFYAVAERTWLVAYDACPVGVVSVSGTA